jgi:hypothetical protein
MFPVRHLPYLKAALPMSCTASLTFPPLVLPARTDHALSVLEPQKPQERHKDCLVLLWEQ